MYRGIYNIPILPSSYLLLRCATTSRLFISRRAARINREMITRVSIKISHPATFINFTSAVRRAARELSVALRFHRYDDV